jgi:hypothetical protein
VVGLARRRRGGGGGRALKGILKNIEIHFIVICGYCMFETRKIPGDETSKK